MNDPFPSHWAEKLGWIWLFWSVLLLSFLPASCFEWFFYLTLLTISGKAELNPFRFRSILFPVKNFFYNSSSWQFVTLNIWIGPNFYGCSVSFMSAFFPLLPDSCFWMIFCSLYWFESVKTFESVESDESMKEVYLANLMNLPNEHRQFTCDDRSKFVLQWPSS